MSYRAIINKVWDGHHLFSVLVELTYRCNLDCFICYNDVGLKDRPLGKHQYIRLFEDLRDMGTMNLTLSGGEPLVHPDFFALGAKARELGFVVRVKSNGHALRANMARRLQDEVDPFQIEVSLHGASAATHDLQTRLPGSFERLVGNLREMQALGLRLKLSAPLTAWNEHEAEEMMELADALGLKIDFDPHITPRDNGDRSSQDCAPSPEGVERLFRLIRARRRDVDPVTMEKAAAVEARISGPKPAHTERKQHCGTGSTNATIDPMGNVFPCVQWRRLLGNLHQQSIKEIWARSTALQEVRRLSGQVDDFVRGLGKQGKEINFCPALAEQITGSPVRIYPSAALSLDILRRLDQGKEK